MLAVPVMLATLAIVVVACGSSSRSDGPGASSAPAASADSSKDGAAAGSVRSKDGEGDPVPSSGCALGASAAVSLERRTVAVAELERWYLVTVPASRPGVPLPLVVDFHGLSEGAELHSRLTRFGELAEREGFVAVFPHGTGAVVGWAAAPGGSAGLPNPDVDFARTLLDRLEDDLCIDRSRVYLTGVSNGAMLTSMLSCRFAERIAAVAPVSGVAAYDGCEPTVAVPMLTIHGTADPILLFNGGVGDLVKLASGGAPPDSSPTTVVQPADLRGPGYPANVAAWAERNGCEPEPVDEDVTVEVIHRSYDCPTGAEVEMYIVRDGGHAWPGSDLSRGMEAVMGHTTFDIDATELVWEFLSAYRRDVEESIG